MPADDGRKVLLLRLDGHQQTHTTQMGQTREETRLNHLRSHTVAKRGKGALAPPAPLEYPPQQQSSGLFAHTDIRTSGKPIGNNAGSSSTNHTNIDVHGFDDLPPHEEEASERKIQAGSVRQQKNARKARHDDEVQRTRNLSGIISNEMKKSNLIGLEGMEARQLRLGSFLPDIDETHPINVKSSMPWKTMTDARSSGMERQRSVSNPVPKDRKTAMDILPQFGAPPYHAGLPGRKVSMSTSYGTSVVRFLPSLHQNQTRDQHVQDPFNRLTHGFDQPTGLQVQGIFKSAQPDVELRKPLQESAQYRLQANGLKQSFSSPVGFLPTNSEPLSLELHASALLEYRRAIEQAKVAEEEEGFLPPTYQDSFKYLSPQEIRDRMIEYNAQKIGMTSKRRASNADSLDKPAWRPSGAAAMNLGQIMKNRMRAKELAEKTRKELFESDEEDEEEEEFDLGRYSDRNYIYLSSDSVAEETVGPFHHEPEELRDENGNLLPTANKFAHNVLKVMTRHEPAGQAFAKQLQPRPQAAPKPQINYPAIRTKKQEPEPEQKPSIPDAPAAPIEPAIEPLVERPATVRPTTEKRDHVRETLELIVSRMDNELIPPRHLELTLRELRVIFVNDFAIIDTRETTLRENEMAMLLRDIDALPTVFVEDISPELVCEMCWNLFRYLRAMLPDCLVPPEVGEAMIEIMEDDDADEEHHMFQMKRVMAKLSREDFIIVKAIFGHLTRLGTAFLASGLHLNKSISYLFSGLLCQIPCRSPPGYARGMSSQLPRQEQTDIPSVPIPVVERVAVENADEIKTDAAENASSVAVEETVPAEVAQTMPPILESESGHEGGAVEVEQEDSTLIGAGAIIESPELDFGEDDPLEFGWNLYSKRSLTRLLLLEEIVHTACSGAMHLLLTHYDTIFAFNSGDDH
ncbi:hypothetical protein HDU97_005978 [Phlyctochytrium planicorne]|nr:hypothetical protein HDU97_005978 [Phlyctochytrium planicorne]